MISKARIYIWPLIAFLTILVIAIVLSLHQVTWTSWRPATCMPTGCFCEELRSSTVRQPSDTWSCFVFVLLGLMIMGRGLADRSDSKANKAINRMRSIATYPVVYGASLIVIGLGSAFYHSSLTFAGQVLDVQGMYFLIAFAFIYGVSRLKAITPKEFVVVYVALCLLLLGLQIWWPDIRRIVFAVLVLTVLVIEINIQARRHSANSTYILAGVLSLAIGFAIWFTDQNKILCVPDSIVQGHAIWHILSAVAAGFLYLYYRSERTLPATEGNKRQI